MTQLSDLPDDCLIEVLDRLPPGQLFKMQRLNQRMKRLATIKMCVKIVAVRLTKSNRYFSDCFHLKQMRPDQVLVLETNNLQEPSTKILRLFSICNNVRSVDFGDFQLPFDVLLEVFRRSPQLECIKFGFADIKLYEWYCFLDKIGHRIVHLAKEKNQHLFRPDHWVLEWIARKCPNIKRVDWVIDNRLTSELVAAIKMLPKSCWIALVYNDSSQNNVFEDVVDELRIDFSDWSLLSQRVERLSELKFHRFYYPIFYTPLGINFVGLKKLDFTIMRQTRKMWSGREFKCLLASRFPVLEEFCFNACSGFTEVIYDRLFQKMPLLKKLNIFTDLLDDALLPQSAINRLNNLKMIRLDVVSNWPPENFLKQVEQYVDEVSSLKKVTVVLEFSGFVELNKTFVSEVKRLKSKQNRVEIDLLIKNYH